MKALQNNFTTPEQSNRLLELGVPADSADCCLRRILTDGGYCETWKIDVFDFIGQIHDDYLPCWSVGQLIKIYEICFGGYFNSRYFGHTLMEDVLLKIEESIDSMDFSKLEE